MCTNFAEILITKRVKEIAAYGPTSFIQPGISYDSRYKRISINGVENRTREIARSSRRRFCIAPSRSSREPSRSLQFRNTKIVRSHFLLFSSLRSRHGEGIKTRRRMREILPLINVSALPRYYIYPSISFGKQNLTVANFPPSTFTNTAYSSAFKHHSGEQAHESSRKDEGQRLRSIGACRDDNVARHPRIRFPPSLPPSSSTATRTTTIVRKISYKCVLFCW